MDIDIPRLTTKEIHFEKDSFFWTYSVESSSTHSSSFWSLDATGIEHYISFNSLETSPSRYIVKNRTELQSVSKNTEELWIQLFDTAGLNSISFSSVQSLKTLVIGNNLFWGVTCFELSHLHSLQSIHIGRRCFYRTVSSSFVGSFHWGDWIPDLPRLQSIRLSEWSLINCQSVLFESNWIERMSSIDLPKLQSIRLGEKALYGDSRNDRTGHREFPCSYNNTLAMRGESGRTDPLQDLPSLTSFRGDGGSFCNFGFVVLESPSIIRNTCRSPSVVVGWNPVSLLRQRPFLSVFK